MRQVIIHKADPDETGYWAECPSLPGCVSQGETWEETLANIKEAIELWLADAIEYGDPIPPEDVAELESLTVVV